VLLIVPLVGDPALAALYLLVFGLGTIVGMTLITVSVAAPAALFAARLAGMRRSLRLASGAISLVFGMYLAKKIGFGAGLFGAAPHWSPR
jgi:high-affinity nickel-transport protein